MGRAKISMKRIKDERARKLAFMQRRKGLMKKISDFSILCGAEACLIVYDGEGSNGAPAVWPQDPTKVNSMLQKYEHQKVIETPLKTFDVEDYFENKKDLVEAEISKVHKEILKIKYPTWDPSLNNIGEGQLRGFISMLDAKIGACDHRINMLKNMQQSEANFRFMQNMTQQNIPQSQSQHIPAAPMRPLNDNGGMVDSITQVDVPSESTNQVGELVKWDDLDQLVELDDLVEWASQPHVFALQDISFISQNKKQGAA